MSLSEKIPSLGFIGAGNMAGAILGAVASKKLLDPGSIAACDVAAEKVAALAEQYGIRAEKDAAAVLASCEVVVLAIKPQDMAALLESMRAHVRPEHLIVSIAAGVRCKKIEDALPEGTRVVRVMPNTPAMIGEGAAGVAGGANASKQNIRAIVSLFEAVGIAAQVEEGSLDAVTALSGSGPAYVFKFIEVLQEAGEQMGLDPELARRFALQTFVGASKLAAESEDSPAELRRKVTSPGGTTAAALEEFEKGMLDELLLRGIRSARQRSIELAS